MTLRFAALLLLAPALLAAQEQAPAPERARPSAPRGWAVGVTGFTGGVWQPSGVDLSRLFPLGGPSRRHSVGLGLRVGSFVQDQAVLIGGSKGFYASALASLRLVVANLAFVGSERNPYHVRLVTVAEAGATQGVDSPLPQGDSFAQVAALAGFALGNDDRIDESFALLLGPARLAGREGSTLFQVSLRYQGTLGGGR